MQLFAKFKKILRRGFRATLNFWKFKVAHQTLSLEKYWKLFPATLIGLWTTRPRLFNAFRTIDNICLSFSVDKTSALFRVVLNPLTTFLRLCHGIRFHNLTSKLHTFTQRCEVAKFGAVELGHFDSKFAIWLFNSLRNWLLRNNYSTFQQTSQLGAEK